MVKMMKIIIKNVPMVSWLLWLKMVIIMKYKYNDVQIGDRAYIYNTKLEGNNTFGSNTTLGNCAVGRYSYVARNCFINNTKIGRFCSIGSNVISGHGRHPSRKFVSTSPMFFSTLKQNGSTFVKVNSFDELVPVDIGNDVWIGANVFISDGVKIGSGAIVGAGAVVVDDIPPYAVAVGVPAKVIRYRFSEEQIKFLLDDEWWNKPEDVLREDACLFIDIKQYESNYKK